MWHRTLYTAVSAAFFAIFFLIPSAFEAFPFEAESFSRWLQILTSVATLCTLLYLYLQHKVTIKQNTLNSSNFLFSISNLIEDERMYVLHVNRITGYLLSDEIDEYYLPFEFKETGVLFSINHVMLPTTVKSNEITYFLKGDTHLLRSMVGNTLCELITRIGLLTLCPKNHEDNLLNIKTAQEKLYPIRDTSEFGKDIRKLRGCARQYENRLNSELGDAVKNRRQQIIDAHLL